MHRRPRHLVRITASGLVACLWALHVAAFGHVAVHSLDHAQHTATTHGSVLCTWLCTAGEVSEIAAVMTNDGEGVIGFTEARGPSPRASADPLESSSRAPPPSSL